MRIMNNKLYLSDVAGWDVKKIIMVVMIIVLLVIPIAITTLLVVRKYNPSVREFFDHHSRM